MLRRTFLKGAGATLIGAASGASFAQTAKPNTIIDWSNGMKPLYCLAYIDPASKLHRGQESFIAKYPIAVISQDNRPQFAPFRSRLAKLNPSQIVLAYHATLDEHAIPGPAHDIVRKATKSWITLPGGITPKVNLKSGHILQRRLFDPRNREFRDRFIEACDLLVNNQKFNGIFLDNCTVYPIVGNIPVLGEELRQGLQELINEVRLALPNAILIGNSSYSWAGLNGEMNEGRPKDLPKEAAPLFEHQEPNINMYFYTMRNSSDIVSASNNFRFSLDNRCFFGTSVNHQTIKWYSFFDQILANYEIV